MLSTETFDLRIAEAPQTLREIVHERLRAAIIAGRFKSGDRLVERTLCDQLGVSRSVVREVIRYLEADGLVETTGSRGPIVARLDWDQASQIYEIRMQLEASAAADCARRIDDKTRVELANALSRLGAAYTGGDAMALYRASTDLYGVIFRRAGHTIAWDVVQRLNGRISRLRAMTLATRDRHVSGHARIRTICVAIMAGDAEGAAAAVRVHLTEAAAIARSILESEASDRQGGGAVS